MSDYISSDCQKADASFGKHQYACNGYASPGRFCDCWCHRSEAHAMAEEDAMDEVEKAVDPGSQP